MNFIFYSLFIYVFYKNYSVTGKCESGTGNNCEEESRKTSHMKDAVNEKWKKYYDLIKKAEDNYEECNKNCYLSVIKDDLEPFKPGITKAMLIDAANKGTKYQIISGKVYREKECMFPARCTGIEHYLLKVAKNIPDIEMIINTRDWPQITKTIGLPLLPVFSFSKTKDYYDIMYPAWSFWEGGPAISLYPRGLGRWDKHRKSLITASEKHPWEEKVAKGFFRGSRTSAERDALILLSRDFPQLVDAQYTKNQAWKSDSDTLNAPPAKEVSLEEHCKYRYLFNYRGVAASFRFKHLFLCGSLVIHVGNAWNEFFYSALKPWIHYIPMDRTASKEQIREILEFIKENDSRVRKIAARGHKFVIDNLKDTDIELYWLRLLKRYAKLLKFKITKDPELHLITVPRSEL